MGDRANIEMVFEDGNKIYFYTHWAGSELPNTLKSALIRGKGRWDDEPYLARIIFSEMIQDEIFDTTGYGISPYLGDNEHPIIVVNPSKQTVNIDGIGEWSFEEFIKTNLNSF
jgi:hypothetical protein